MNDQPHCPGDKSGKCPRADGDSGGFSADKSGSVATRIVSRKRMMIAGSMVLRAKSTLVRRTTWQITGNRTHGQKKKFQLSDGIVSRPVRTGETEIVP